MTLRGGASQLAQSRAGGALALAVAGAIAAMLLGGCGTATVIDPVARAATVSTAAPGFKAIFSMRIGNSALPAAITATGTGRFDIRDHSGSLNLAMNLGGIPQAAQALGSSTLRIEEIVNRLIFYIKFPPAITRRSAAFHGKPWLKINLAQAEKGLGLGGLSALANNPTSSDPSQFLRYLRGVSGGVTKVGTATVDGFRTTHYRGQIHLDRVADAVPPADRAQVRQSIAGIERLTHLRVMPVNVWIDGSHLVRRMQFAIHETVSGQTLTIAIRMDIPQYGPQLAPTLPPASQVTDITGSVGAGAASSSGS